MLLGCICPPCNSAARMHDASTKRNSDSLCAASLHLISACLWCAALGPSLWQVEGAGMRSLQLSLSQLQQNFKKVEFAATLECSGNRRAEMKAIPAPGGSGHTIKGLDWDAGAIGTAVWGGVKLRDVLLAAGVWARREGSEEQAGLWATESALMLGGLDTCRMVCVVMANLLQRSGCCRQLWCVRP